MTNENAPRIAALNILTAVLYKNANIDDACDAIVADFAKRDSAFIRMLITTTVRRLGQIDDLIAKALEKPLPRRGQTAMNILRLGVAQLMFLKTPPHAAVSTSVDLCRAVQQDFYVPLINAIMRTMTRRGDKWLSAQDAEKLGTPSWLWQSWEQSYGAQKARAIAAANLCPADNFIVVKENPAYWAQKLTGEVVFGNCIRLPSLANMSHMEGFATGDWWVQDAAATFPVRLFDDIQGKHVADICAAPGGKTANLMMRGAHVDAIDISKNRLARVAENLSRLHLSANLIVADATKITGQYDAVLIDAPCSATGTIRRHPELVLHRTQADIDKLADTQARLLTHAHQLVRKGGEVVYCTCSLQKQEGEAHILALKNLYDIIPITQPDLVPFQTSDGFLRTFPNNRLDGFFIAHLRKK